MSMTFIPLSFIPFCTLIALVSMVIQRTHILMTLLALEAMILNLMLLVTLSNNMSSHLNLFLAMVMLTFGACEATLGLACLVKMTRTFGNDQLSSSSSTLC